MAGITNETEIVNTQRSINRPLLFIDDGIAFDTWVEGAVEDPSKYQEAQTPSGIVPVLQDLAVASTAGAPNWQRWRKPDENEDILNYYSAVFSIPRTRDTIDYRLNVRLPFRHFAQVLVDLEVKTLDPNDRDQEIIIVGQQARFTPGEDEPVGLSLKDYPETNGYQAVTPDGEFSSYWDRFVKAAVTAHAEFVAV